MEYFVEIIKAIAWPVTLLCLVYFLKADLQSLLKRISSVKYKDVEAIFEKDVNKAHAIAKELGRKSGSSQSQKSTEIERELNTKDQLYRIAQISPRASIVEAWRYFEEKIKWVGLKFGIETKGSATEIMIIKCLIEDKKIDEDFIKLFIMLRELRNRAVHVQEFVLTQKSAEEFIDTIIELNEELELLVEYKPV